MGLMCGACGVANHCLIAAGTALHIPGPAASGIPCLAAATAAIKMLFPSALCASMSCSHALALSRFVDGGVHVHVWHGLSCCSV